MVPTFVGLVLLAVAATADVSMLFRPHQPPFGSSFGDSTQRARSFGSPATILRLDSDISDNGFRYIYQTSDGTMAEQEGRKAPGATPEAGGLAVSGSYTYEGTDGQTYTVAYTADEGGYRARGAHLPTPPPIPDAIAKSLQLTRNAGFLQADQFRASNTFGRRNY